MEEETYTRWLFPGAFAAGTFLWLAYNFDTSVADNLFSSEASIKMIVV